MGLKEDLYNQINDYLAGDYEVRTGISIPSAKDVGMSKKAVEIKMCSLSLDIRNSSKLMDEHKKQTCAKIHKSFLLICSKVVKYFGGSIRSFNGDGLLAFWFASDENINSAVRAAMTIKYLVDQEFTSSFEKYSKIDFGIGIDYGDTFIVRAGIARDDDDNDLVFIGKCVNFSVAIADQARHPYHVEISPEVYDKLDYKHKYAKNKEGNDVLMWKDGSLMWKGEKCSSKITSYYWEI